ncbi:MAG: membrane protein insertion efficiency factor YidD [Bacteroidota bacterium]|nr:membrane protein insertion efficiency factor YidD [Bacteroidota bacterium]
MMNKISILLLVTIGFSAESHAQQDFLSSFISESDSRSKHLTNETGYASPVSNLFLFYKKFISSQDSHHCVYTPSCSEYAHKVISKKGYILGIPATFDRLSRCTKEQAANYKKDKKTGLALDHP